MPNPATPVIDKEILLKIIAIANTPDAAEYFFSQLVKVTKAEDVIKIGGQFVKNVRTEREERANSWEGKDKVKTDFQHAQERHGVMALNEVKSDLVDGNIKMDFAIHDDLSHLLRAFTHDKQSLSPEMASVLDKLFNAWLAENDMISKDSIIYEADEKGEEKRDKNGNPIRANAEKLRDLIGNEQEGFTSYLRKIFTQHMNDKQLNCIIQEHAYPEQRPVSAPAAARETVTTTPQTTGREKAPTETQQDIPKPIAPAT